MGCWSHEIFCDDSSLDALDELSTSEDIIHDIETFIDNAVNCKEQLDYDVCQYALAAAAIVDAALNGADFSLLTGTDEDDSVTELLESISADMVRNIRQKAVQAIRLVMNGDSELKELAEENEEFFMLWKNNLEKIIMRLEN